MIPIDRLVPPALSVASSERARRLEERLRGLLAQAPVRPALLGRMAGVPPHEVGAALRRLGDQGIAAPDDSGRWSLTQ